MMNHCVPSWDLEENSIFSRLNYEVAELTWNNGQPAFQGLPRVSAAGSGDTGGCGGGGGGGGGDTLESIVNQATTTPHYKSTVSGGGSGGGSSDLQSGLVVQSSGRGGAATITTMDALVPCSKSTTTTNNSSGTCGSRQVTAETCERDDDDDDDSVCHGEEGGNKKGTVSTKRIRKAAIHNQSERKRRDKINQRMRTLQKMIPNSSKSDKASMLDEVIEYLKKLQAQVHMMSRMNSPQIMLPLAMQQRQQLQMSMASASLGMGLPGLGMGMSLLDMNSMGRGNIPGMPPLVHPSALMPNMTHWDGGGDRLPSSASAVVHDPLMGFLATQSQPMAMDAYTRMATLFQQFQCSFPGEPFNHQIDHQTD